MNSKSRLILIFLGLSVAACSSGGGGSSGGGPAATDTVSFTGRVLVTSTSNVKTVDTADDTGVPYSHVNLCTVSSSGAFQVVPGTSTVVADGTGKFTLSINKKTVPASGSVAICVSSPGGIYELYSLVPTDLLPTASNQITTVSLDVTGESTIVTLFLCSQAMLSISASKGCQILDSDLTALETALNDQGGSAPEMPLTASEWNSFFTTNGQSTGGATQFQSAIEAWGQGQGFNSGWLTFATMSAIPNQTNTFNPVQPITDLVSSSDPSGGWSGSFTTAGPGPCAGMSGSWTASMVALGNNLTGTWSSSAGPGGALSGNTTNGALTYQIGGGGGASFSGAISGGGLAIGGSWSGGTHCTGGGTDYGATYGSFSGARN